MVIPIPIPNRLAYNYRPTYKLHPFPFTYLHSLKQPFPSTRKFSHLARKAKHLYRCFLQLDTARWRVYCRRFSRCGCHVFDNRFFLFTTRSENIFLRTQPSSSEWRWLVSLRLCAVCCALCAVCCVITGHRAITSPWHYANKPFHRQCVTEKGWYLRYEFITTKIFNIEMLPKFNAKKEFNVLYAV